MELRLPLAIQPQPDDMACGPTCLHAVYAYYGEAIALATVIAEVRALAEGGTLAVFLAEHAMRRGYRATIYTYNLRVFDPTWFADAPVDLRAKLNAQYHVKDDPKLREATKGYLAFLDGGGHLAFADLTVALIRRHLARHRPILTGLSATYLYQSAREIGVKNEYDDVRGEPVGHFVVLCGYNAPTHEVLVADPLHANPVSGTGVYAVDADRALNAILLGVLTYDANLLILDPPEHLAPGGD